MALAVIGVCENCGAQQLDNGMIMVNPEQATRCQTHDFAKIEEETINIQEKGGGRRNEPPEKYELPTTAECKANDALEDHKAKVETKISQTQNTIATLEASHEHWRQVIQDDFQRVMNAAENRRDVLLDNLDQLVQTKQTLLAGQLDEYQEHFSRCQDMLDDIYRRIHLDVRNAQREQNIKEDSRKTIQAFPRLDIIPIAVAAECQTQPMVENLDSFGAILESGLGRLPTVLIEQTIDDRSEIVFSVIEPEDAEEKMSVNFIAGLMIEIQASVYYDRSSGWDVSWTKRIPCDEAKGKMKIMTRELPPRETVGIRARTVIIESDKPNDPIRISRWSDVSVMPNKQRGPPLPTGRSGNLRERPPVSPVEEINPQSDEPVEVPTKKIFVICLDPKTGNKLPCRPAPPDYIGAIRGAAIRKWKWNCSPEDIQLKIVSKNDQSQVMSDLTQEVHPNNVLAEMWDRNAHFVHVVKEMGGEEPPPRPVSPIPPQLSPDPVDVVWPNRLMVRIKEQPTRDSPARPLPLRLEERDQPGGWLGGLKRRYCERFNLSEEGEMSFYFVDDEGNRVKDIRRDVDFLYVQENRRKVYAVGESV